jgi:hypothetical protein
MAEFKTHVGLADSKAGDQGATPAPGNEPRPTAGTQAARPAPGPTTDKQAKGAGQGGGEAFDNFTPNTEAVLPESSIAAGLDAAQEEMTRGTEQAAADPDKGAGTQAPAPKSNGAWIALGLAALVVAALVLRPRRRRA